MAQPLTLVIALSTKIAARANCRRFGKILILTEINELFIMPGRLRIRPVGGLHGMLFVQMFRPGLIYRPRFKNVRGLRRFITYLNKNWSLGADKIYTFQS